MRNSYDSFKEYVRDYQEIRGYHPAVEATSCPKCGASVGSMCIESGTPVNVGKLLNGAHENRHEFALERGLYLAAASKNEQEQPTHEEIAALF